MMNQAVLKMCDDWGVPPETSVSTTLVADFITPRITKVLALAGALSFSDVRTLAAT